MIMGEYMRLKQKIANVLIHNNPSLDYELQHYSLGLKQKKIAKIKSKDKYLQLCKRFLSDGQLKTLMHQKRIIPELYGILDSIKHKI